MTWLIPAAADCVAATDAYYAAARLHEQANRHRDLLGDIATFRRREATALRLHREKYAACQKRFADERGLKVGKPTCSIAALIPRSAASSLDWAAIQRLDDSGCSNVIDHAIELKQGRRVVAVLSHTYRNLDTCKAFAAAHGLAWEALAASWYSSQTVAVVFTRKDQK